MPEPPAPLRARFQAALREVMDDLARDPEVMAVVFFGSVQRGEGTDHSDLDFFVVTSRPAYWRRVLEAGGVTAELFVHPQERMRALLETEDQIAITAWATGELLLDRLGQGRTLVEQAREILAAGPRPLDPEAIARWRYRISALADDLEGLAHEGAEARLLAAMLLPLALEGHCALHRRWSAPPVGLLNHVAQSDPEIAAQARACLAAGLDPALAIRLADGVLGPFGGRLAAYGTEPRRCG